MLVWAVDDFEQCLVVVDVLLDRWIVVEIQRAIGWMDFWMIGFGSGSSGLVLNRR